MKRSPYLRYAINDLIKNKGVNAALLLILIFCAALMVTGAMVMERLVGSVDQLFAEAQPPHFLQMHSGDFDREALAAFADERPEIDAWLIEEMLGFDGSTVAWSRPSTGESGDLGDSLIDNLFVTQNREFDFLIDEQGTIAHPSPGEIYVPVGYQQQYALNIGDTMTIRTDSGIEDLRIRGFVRDAQMASSMSSATRFLVSETDFAALRHAGGGAAEIIVEYRLTDPSLVSQFQQAYASEPALPKNGQAVTYQMIRLINSFSDGLVAVALMFVSLLVITIALLTVRFVIRGSLEDEVHEIGAMKAIGIPSRDIAGLYLAKYSVLTVLACVLGGLLGIAGSTVLMRSIRVNYAEAPPGVVSVVVPLLALVIIYLIVTGICRGVLRSLRRIEVVGALIHGSTRTERQTARRAARQARRVRRTRLATAAGRRVNRRLAVLDLRAEAGSWVLIPIVFFLVALLMTLPMNLLSTFQSPRFVTYMGAPHSDLRVDVRFSDDADAVRDEILAQIRSDHRLTAVTVFSQVLYETEGEDGWESLRVEVGDYSEPTIEFLSGERPGPGQIALSLLTADKYAVTTGDELIIRQGDEPTTAVVSGVYSDVTSGGYTAKMHGSPASGATAYVIYADAAEGTDVAGVAAEYDQRHRSATVVPMQEYLQQTLAYITDALGSAAVLSFVLGVGIALLITCVFLGLRLTRDRRTMGVLSAIGFSGQEIIGQVRGKVLFTTAVGTLLGVVGAATVGEAFAGFLISLAGLGIGNLSFIPNPWLVYLAYPLILIGAGYLGAVLLTAPLRRADTSSWLK